MKRYRALIQVNRKATALIVEAENIDKASRIAESKGKLLSIKKELFFKKWLEVKMDKAEQQVFLQRLSAMISSKVSATKALTIMAENFIGPIRKASTRMLGMVESGMTIGQAMEVLGSRYFNSQVIALVIAGERSGSTGIALKSAAKFQAEMERVKSGASIEMLKGVLGLIIGGGFIIIIRYFLAPVMLGMDLVVKNWEMVKEGVNHWKGIADVSIIVFAVIMVFIIGVWLLSSLGRVVVPNYADKIVMKIPVVKSIILAKKYYASLYGLSLLISSGMSIRNALKISAESSGKGQLKRDYEAAYEAIMKGKSWAHEMYSLHPTDKAALAMVQDRAQTAETLNDIAEQYKAIYISQVAITAPVIQFTAVVFMALCGGIIFGLTIAPILQLSAGGL